MKRILVISLLGLWTLSAFSQVTFKTVTPQRAVVEGDPFQVQYVIEGGEKISGFISPDFKGFHKAAGPYIYSGTLLFKPGVKVNNTVYTLVANRPGKFTIPGTVATVNGISFRSNDALIDVISREEALRRSKKEADAADYFLRPGEDPQEKIRKNLFVKVMVNKRTCFVGEPIVATFKLYSRLESKSDIIKNPGFYGFTVYDMISLDDKQSNIEIINGRTFDVHTIRKVQLYPLQEGKFMVDAMDIRNTIEFSRSAVNKKTEQEIVEGVLIDDTQDNEPTEGTTTFETTIHTEPVAIAVKPIPEKNRPDSFNGATGNFSISTNILQSALSKNEEGIIAITISGKGNFTQLNAPVIQWPAGMEGFEPVIKDVLDKTQSPLSGSRTFRYTFVSASSGNYTIPLVTLSFFNPDSGSYKTISTVPLEVTISNNEKPTDPVSAAVKKKERSGNRVYWLTGAIALLVWVGAAGWIIGKKKKEKQKAVLVEESATLLSAKELLSPARLLIHADASEFYSFLQQTIWVFFEQYFHLSGSEKSKTELGGKLREKGIEAGLIRRITDVLQQCEEGMFTNANLATDKEALLKTTRETLDELDTTLL